MRHLCVLLVPLALMVAVLAPSGTARDHYLALVPERAGGYTEAPDTPPLRCASSEPLLPIQSVTTSHKP